MNENNKTMPPPPPKKKFEATKFERVFFTSGLSNLLSLIQTESKFAQGVSIFKLPV